MSEKVNINFLLASQNGLVSYLRTKAKGIRIILLCDVVFGSVYTFRMILIIGYIYLIDNVDCVKKATIFR